MGGGWLIQGGTQLWAPITPRYQHLHQAPLVHSNAYRSLELRTGSQTHAKQTHGVHVSINSSI